MATGAASLNGNRKNERRKRKCALTSTGLLVEGVDCAKLGPNERIGLPSQNVVFIFHGTSVDCCCIGFGNSTGKTE